MAYYHRILKEDFSRRRQIFAGLMPVQTVLEAAQATGYRWRHRIWTPWQTLWTFLLQTLTPGSSLQRPEAMLPYMWLFAGTSRAQQLHQLLLKWIAHHILPHRPNRLEPRVKKRRPKTYSLMNQPRPEMRKALLP